MFCDEFLQASGFSDPFWFLRVPLLVSSRGFVYTGTQYIRRYWNPVSFGFVDNGTQYTRFDSCEWLDSPTRFDFCEYRCWYPVEVLYILEPSIFVDTGTQYLLVSYILEPSIFGSSCWPTRFGFCAGSSISIFFTRHWILPPILILAMEIMNASLLLTFWTDIRFLGCLCRSSFLGTSSHQSLHNHLHVRPRLNTWN